MRALVLMSAAVCLAACTPSPLTSALSANRLPTGIVDGKLAAETDVAPGGQAESVVAIYTGDALCSGTLITPEIVLTAAHCFEDVKSADQLQVLLHVINMFAPNQTATAVAFKVAAYTVNPNFSEENKSASSLDDLALIRLAHAVPAGTRIATLPKADFDYTSLKQVMAFGYGTANDKHSAGFDESGAGILRYTAFPSSSSNCYRRMVPWAHRLAACSSRKPDETAVCSGDSGGPLMQSVSNVSSNLVVGVNDAVIAHYKGQPRKRFRGSRRER